MANPAQTKETKPMSEQQDPLAVADTLDELINVIGVPGCGGHKKIMAASACIRALVGTIAALKKRLALAETLCLAHDEWLHQETIDGYNAAVDKRHVAWKAWREGKGWALTKETPHVKT